MMIGWEKPPSKCDDSIASDNAQTTPPGSVLPITVIQQVEEGSALQKQDAQIAW